MAGSFEECRSTIPGWFECPLLTPKNEVSKFFIICQYLWYFVKVSKYALLISLFFPDIPLLQMFVHFLSSGAANMKIALIGRFSVAALYLKIM